MTLPLAALAGGGVFLELGALLLALAVLARIGLAARVSTIPLYLLGGLVIGAFEPLDVSEDFIEVGGQIGLVLLLFMLGLEYSAGELTENVRVALPAGLLDAVLNFTPGLLAGLILGWDATAAFLLGGATYISSSGVIAKVLEELGRLGNRETPSVLSLLVIEDLAMVAYLPVATVLLASGELPEALRSIGVALAAAAVILFAALRHGEALSRLVASRSDEVLLLTLFGLVLAVGGAAERAHLQIGPLRDLFAATFFVFFGLSIDAEKLPAVAVPALLLALATAATKLVTAWWAARRAGAGARGRARAGTVFIARGEFSIVIAGLGVAAGVEDALGPLVAAYVLMTAIAGAVVTRFADRLVRPPARPRAVAPDREWTPA